MKCKDCRASKIVKCPKCDEKIILCEEGNDLVEYIYWDNEDIRCDGIG